MKRFLTLICAGFLLGALATGILAQLGSKYLYSDLVYYGRRVSPAWVRFGESTIGAPDLKALYERFEDKEEWDIMVLMNEVHGHIGPWSIVGCKMGLRAMDLLGAPYHTMTIISEGGNKPPNGCISDGMLMGTSCTIGRGLFKLSSGPYRPAGVFIYQDRAVRLEAKPFVSQAIRDSIQAIIAQTGGEDYADYWKRVRAFGIQVWEAWDRREIFAETWIDPATAVTTGEPLSAQPEDFALAQNTPNPFNTTTAISFTLPQDGPVELGIYDAAGQRVRTLLRGTVPTGKTALTWDGRDDLGQEAGNGVYFYKLLSGDGRLVATRKMCLLK